MLLAAIVTLAFSGRAFGPEVRSNSWARRPRSDQARFNRATPPPGLGGSAGKSPVSVDLDSLNPASGTPPSQLSIELFDRVEAAVPAERRSESARRGTGNFTSARRRMQGHARGRASFTVVGGEISGIVELGDTGRHSGGTYKVQSNRDGLKLLEEIDTSAFPPDQPPSAGRPGHAGDPKAIGGRIHRARSRSVCARMLRYQSRQRGDHRHAGCLQQPDRRGHREPPLRRRSSRRSIPRTASMRTVAYATRLRLVRRSR